MPEFIYTPLLPSSCHFNHEIIIVAFVIAFVKLLPWSKGESGWAENRFSNHRPAPGEPPACRRLPCQAVDTRVSMPLLQICPNPRLTESGLSVGFTLVPSKRKRTLVGALPLLSQKASISFFNCVVRLILKKISLLLSVTLMLRCSLSPPSGRGAPFGEP